MRILTTTICVLALLGCSSTDFDDPVLTVFMIEPHERSSHFSEDITFQATAINDAGLPVSPGTAFEWEVRRAEDLALISAFQGSFSQRDIDPTGDYVVGLVVTEPGYGWGTVRTGFRVAQTVGTIRSPDAHQILAAGTSFDVDLRAETDVGNLSQVTLSIVNQANGAQELLEVFTTSSDSYSTTVPVSLPAGSYVVFLTVTTNNPGAFAEDRIPVSVNG